MTQLIIQNGNHAYLPVVEDDVQWTTKRQGEAGALYFSTIDDDTLNFEEGNIVSFQYKGTKIFQGFVFAKRSNKNGLIEVTAYDQLRYLKNKDTYLYTNKRADQVIRMIANDFGLRIGSLQNTHYVIPNMIEDNKTLFDMINNALDTTLQMRGQQYTLYDDFGKLTLKDINNMMLDSLVDGDTAEDYNYESSIDSDTYNKVKLIRENEEKGTREVYIAQDSKNIGKWGMLQYFETLGENENGKAKADALLRLYNSKTRTLSIPNQLGDVRVRGGSLVPVSLKLDDIKITNMMVVDSVNHYFKRDQHFMDLNLWGGDFSA